MSETLCLHCKRPVDPTMTFVCDKECGTIFCGFCLKPNFGDKPEHDKKCPGIGKKVPDPTEECRRCRKYFKVAVMKYEFGDGKKYCQPCHSVIPKKDPASTVPKPIYVDPNARVPGLPEVDESKNLKTDSRLLTETFSRAEGDLLGSSKSVPVTAPKIVSKPPHPSFGTK